MTKPTEAMIQAYRRAKNEAQGWGGCYDRSEKRHYIVNGSDEIWSFVSEDYDAGHAEMMAELHLLRDEHALSAGLSIPDSKDLQHTEGVEAVSKSVASVLAEFRKFVDLIEGRAMACDGPVTPFLDELHVASDAEKERFTSILRRFYAATPSLTGGDAL